MDQFYNTRRLNQIFTVLNLTALALIGVVLYKEHRPEWYPYQKTFITLYQEYTQKELKRVRQELEEDETFKELEKRVRELYQALQQNPRYRRLREEADQIRRELERTQTELAEIRLDYLAYEDAFFWSVGGRKVYYRERMEALEPTIKALSAKVEDLQRRLQRAERELKELETGYREALEQKSRREFERERAIRAVEAAMGMVPEIKQIHLPQLKLVDRCITCHAGYDKPESWGQFLTERIKKMREKGAKEEEIAILRALMPHPRQEELFSNHPPDEFGCTSCHLGQGVALKKEVAHAYNEKHWETPMLPMKYVEAGCGRCHRYEMTLAGAPKLSRGRFLFALLGCWGCHDAKGYDNLIKIGPSLTHIAEKTSPEWTFRWIKDPDAWNPNSRMPMFFFDDEQSWALVAYLFHASRVIQGKEKPLIPELKNLYNRQPLQLARKFPGGDPVRGKQLVKEVGCLSCHTIKGLGGPKEREKGTRLLGRYDFGPDLSKIGSKITNPDWLYHWLLDPKALDPLARMPNMRLTEREAADITAYLLTLKETAPKVQPVSLSPPPHLNDPTLIEEGFRLIANYGCHGCHYIPGTEELTKIGKDLSSEADIDPHIIDFARRVHEIFQEAPTYWDRKYIWLKEKILNPRSFREGLRMPDFKLTEEEAQALLIALLSFTGREIPHPYFRDRDIIPRIKAISEGQKIIIGYNCVGCHIIEGYGGDIWPMLEDGMQPPNLKSQGARVNHGWLFRFLRDPTMGTGRQHAIRPWLKVRMPTFDNLTDEQLSTLIRYFAALDNEPILKEFRSPYRPDPKLVTEGKKLFDMLQCLACHPTGPVGPGADVAQLAPNLQLARERLQPEWIVEWLLDPPKFQPGTRMPTFFPRDEETGEFMTPFPEFLGGDARKQAQALRDYMMTLAK